MPQTKVENRYCSKSRKKYDASETNYVTYEIGDESSPESSPPLNGFLQKDQLVKSDPCQDAYSGSKNEDKFLSVLSKNRTPENTAHRDLGLDPTNLVNGHCSNDEDSKSSLFSDSLLSSLTCKPNKEDMKVINGCDTPIGDFSDLLSSISLPDHGSKGNVANFEVYNRHSVDHELLKSTSNYSTELNNLTTGNNDKLSSILSSISSTELDVNAQNRQNSSSRQNKPQINNGGLSDILSSISFDETDTSQQNGCTSFLNSAHRHDYIKGFDSKELISDFPLLNSHILNSSLHSTPAELQNKSSLSDILSSITYHEDSKTKENEHKSTSFTNQNLGNDSLFNLKELSTEFLGSKDCTPEDKSVSFSAKLNDASDNDIQNTLLSKSNIDDLLSLAVDTPKTTDPVNSFTKDEKTDFSFFSASPDNVFSSMLSNLHTNSNQQDKNTDENTDNISMLDLLKSVNTDSSSTTDPVNSFTNDEKTDFSFFSASPDNVFSSMLSNLHTNSNQQDKNSDEITNNMSMLDLLKSVNTDPSSSLTGYLNMPGKTAEIITDKKAVLGGLSEILDIDLSVCIKTSEDTDTLRRDLPVNSVCIDSDYTADVKLEDYMKPVFDEVDSNRPRVNRSQSLFAKALSCKPKRNPELVKKAFYVKSELYRLYFNRESPAELDKNFKMKEDIYTNNEMVVCKTNTCMITFKGRRFCPHEVN